MLVHANQIIKNSIRSIIYSFAHEIQRIFLTLRRPDYEFKYDSRWSPGIAGEFFATIPNTKTNYVYGRDLAAKSGGTAPEIIAYAGSAILSSAAIAAAIKAWIEGRRRKIVLSVGSRKLEYEGPDLKHDLKVIQAMIEKLSNDSGSRKFIVSAMSLPDEQSTSFPQKDQHNKESDQP